MELTTVYQRIGSGQSKNYNGAIGHIELWAKYNSQNIENNQSSVSIELRLVVTNGYIGNYQATNWSISGDLNANGNIGSGSHYSKTLGSATGIIQHNNDGTKSVSFNGSFNPTAWGSSYTLSVTGTATLPTIPRASSFTLSKTSGGDEVSSFNLRESIYVNITRASDTFTHRVYFVVGSSGNQLLASSAATSANGVLNINLANYIPTPSSVATMYVDTYSGSTLIGSSSKTFILTVPDDVRPTISSVTTSDTQDRLSVFGAYVQGKSTLRIQTNASGVYGSSILSYLVQIKSGDTVLQTLSGSDVSLTNISYTGNLVVNITVTDSRGRTAIYTTSVTVLEYSNPQINTFNITRNSNTPTNVSVSINAIIVPLNNNNSKSFILKYKKTSELSWTTVTLSSSNYNLDINHLLSNIDENSSYNFQLIVADYFTSNTRENDLGTAFELLNWKSDGTAMALGKVSEISNSFECDLDPYFKKIKLYDSTNLQWVDLEVEVVDTW